jgi:predicted tellurium resistance membrane protein TerC
MRIAPKTYMIPLRRDPFIVYTSNIFAILGLRAMYFLLARIPTSTRTRRVTERLCRLKATAIHFLGFALVLLSMFFFNWPRSARTLIA